MEKQLRIVAIVFALTMIFVGHESASAGGISKDRVTVAAINFEPVQQDKPATLQKMKHFAENAADKGANIVLFPETALTGWGGFPPEKAPALAETLPGPASDFLADIAAKRNLFIAFGLIEKKNGKTYNSVAFIGPKGLIGVYRKTHPFEKGEPWATKGDNYPTFGTPWGPIGIGICVENYLQAEVARIYALQGVRILLQATAFPEFPDAKDYREFLKTTLGARAIENNMFVVCANLVGREGETSFFGYSTILGPKPGQMNYHIFAGPAGTKEEIVMATLNLSSLQNLPMGVQGILERRRPETYSILVK